MSHLKLRPGDVVVLKVTFGKPYQYPMAVVSETEENDLGEVVSATVRKNNGEFVRRHVSDLIYLFSSDFIPSKLESQDPPSLVVREIQARKSAVACRRANKDLSKANLV